MNIEQNMALFRELMLCSGDIYTWCYDADGKLLSSNCPDEAVFATAFEAFGCLEKMLSLSRKLTTPTLLSTDTGLTWGAAFEQRDGKLLLCHVLGPVFFSGVSAKAIYRGISAKDWTGYSATWLHTFQEALFRVPTAQHIVFSRNLTMLHYCLTGESVHVSDLAIADAQAIPAVQRMPRDRHKVWTAEQAMLQMVKLGDLNYHEALNTSMMISNGVQVRTDHPVQQAQISGIVFCSLVCRAAIEGGLSPEEGYSLGDAYIQNVVDAKTIDDISTVCATMYDDFVRRVHRMRENPQYSEPIQRCCNYIEMNIDRNIRAQDLANLVGYTTGYITKRFHKETGFGISDYVKLARIERAKILLSSTDRSIQEISDQLGFTSRNYFTRSFRDVTGMTPKEFRNS